MVRIEDEFMRGNLFQFLKADLLKGVEESVFASEQNVLVISNTREIFELKSRDNPYLNQLPARPTLAPYFSGRQDELACLLELLEQFGSAVIT